jgi:hypothetical protein
MLTLNITNDQARAFGPCLGLIRGLLADRLGAEDLTPRLEDQITKTIPVLDGWAAELRAHNLAVGREGVASHPSEG